MPAQNNGMEGQARVIGAGVATAMTKMLTMLDPMSEDAKDVRRALDIITKRFGPASQDLSRAQARTFMAQAPGVTPGPQQAAQRQLGTMGLQPKPAQ